jgi:hypothetical protein
MYPVKQSTTLTVPVFAHDVSGDAVTGLTDGGFTKRISKNGGAFAAMTVTITEMENGWYSVPLSTSHTNTNGVMSITLTHASAKQINLQFRVGAKLTDDLNDVAATDIVSAGAITTLSGAVVNVDTVDTCTTNTDMRGTDSAALASVCTEARLSELDAGTAGKAANQIDIIQTDTTTDIPAQISGLNDIAATDIVSAGAITTLSGAVVNVDTVDTCTTNTDMRGTDSAALASVCTEARLSELDEATAGKMANQVDIIQIDTTTDIPATITTLQSDTDDIQTRLPAALIGGKMDSDIEAINNSTSAAVNLGKSANQIIPGACEGTPTTTIIQTDLAETQDDVYIGRTIIFLDGTSQDEATDITDYTGATGTLTVTALANAPTAGDLFIII